MKFSKTYNVIHSISFNFQKGYVLAMVDFNDQEECALVKYFPPEKTDIWEKELNMLEKMMDKLGSQDGCMGLPKYKWHCSGTFLERHEIELKI